jgi:hypothetical protein
MADLLDQLHINAGLGLLRADGSLTVYPDTEGNTPLPASRADHYVRVYTSIERPAEHGNNNLGGASSTWTVRWYCHCVGPNEYSAAAVGMRVRAALLDVRPTIAGRTCGLIRQDAGNPPTRDETTGVPVMDEVTVYRLVTGPG